MVHNRDFIKTEMKKMLVENFSTSLILMVNLCKKFEINEKASVVFFRQLIGLEATP